MENVPKFSQSYCLILKRSNISSVHVKSLNLHCSLGNKKSDKLEQYISIEKN